MGVKYCEIETHYIGSTRVFYDNLTPALRTLRRRFQNVIRHAGVGAGNAVEDVIERNLGASWIAVLAGLDQLLRLRRVSASISTTCCCSGVGSRKSCGMAGILSLRAGYRSRLQRFLINQDGTDQIYGETVIVAETGTKLSV